MSTEETGIVKDLGDSFSFSRCKFSSSLPKSCRYTAGHFWLAPSEDAVVPQASLPVGPELWRVGFTKLAVRMLGDFVELNFETQPGEGVHLGDTIGCYEGFKAVADLYCVVDGLFHRVNPALDLHGELTRTDPHGAGWLYEVRGVPDPASVDVHGYIDVLNAMFDKMQAEDAET